MATERLDSVRSVALGVWIAAGSRLEPVELGGISHFIEHLIFKGSDKFSASQIAHIFDDMGAEPNASTSKEYTLVNARLLDEDLDKAFEVIAEMVARPSFADLDQEREVVLEEVAMYEDSPPELIHDDLCEVVFGEHPLGRPIIGHYETLAALDLDTVRGYHDAHYVNPGVVIAASGHVDHERVAALAATHFRPEPGAEVVRAELSAPETRHLARFTQKDTEQYHVCLGGPGPRRGDPDRYAAFVVDTILGGSWSSHLFQEVREKRGLAYSVYSYTSLYADAGLAAVYFGSRQEAVEEAMQVILETLAGLEAQMTDAAISRAKNHLKGQLVLSMESPGARMQTLGRAVLLEQPVLTVDEVLARIDAVDRDATVAAVGRYYDPETWSTACIGPQPEPFRAVTQGFVQEER
ncbi:MAG TPA: pitrilysin family protein [Thermoleophilia bacterium]|nr:pitrilysin family protein [Thermoleophilia bacterium]